MCKFNPKNESRRLDPCMKNLIAFLNQEGIKTVACCCGHDKYPMTIVVETGLKNPKLFREVCNDIFISRQKRFYKRDKQGVYYIPETLWNGKANL